MQKLSMKEVQQGALNILVKIDEICRSENLSYYLAYGTLIGAIRHKGFIPWDDDIDIMMPRRDYDCLVNYFIKHKEELKPFEIINPQNNAKCPFTISRISDSSYKLVVDNEDDYGLGLFVDIYPLDGVGNSVEEYTKLKNESCALASLCFLSSRQKVKKENTKSRLKMLAKYPAFVVSKFVGKDRLMKKLYELADKCDYENSMYIGCIIWASDDGLRGIFPKEWFSESIDVEFEGRYFKAPKEYDKVLSHGYGNYMELPPEKDRIAHHYYDAYKK